MGLLRFEGVAFRDRGQGGRETGSSARHMLATPALKQLVEPGGAEITSLCGMLIGNSKQRLSYIEDQASA